METYKEILEEFRMWLTSRSEIKKASEIAQEPNRIHFSFAGNPSPDELIKFKGQAIIESLGDQSVEMYLSIGSVEGSPFPNFEFTKIVDSTEGIMETFKIRFSEAINNAL